MRFKATKSKREIQSQLPVGVEVTTEIVDGSLKRLTISSKAGVLMLTEESYSMRVAIPAPPETVKRFQLRGIVGSLPKVEETFKERYEAESRRDTLVSELSCGPELFGITEIEVEEEEE